MVILWEIGFDVVALVYLGIFFNLIFTAAGQANDSFARLAFLSTVFK